MKAHPSENLTLTDFLRRAGDVLDLLAEGDVRLKRRDGDDLVLTTAARQEAVRGAIEILARALAARLPPQGGAEQDAASHSTWLGLLDDERRFLTELVEAAAVWVDLGTTGPLQRVIVEARRAARQRAERAHTFRRPVAVPDVGRAKRPRGAVRLPVHIRWSGRPISYDLADPVQLRRVYEQVLREGNDDDVRRFIDRQTLEQVWDDLVLPRHVRLSWAEKLGR